MSSAAEPLRDNSCPVASTPDICNLRPNERFPSARIVSDRCRCRSHAFVHLTQQKPSLREHFRSAQRRQLLAGRQWLMRLDQTTSPKDRQLTHRQTIPDSVKSLQRTSNQTGRLDVAPAPMGQFRQMIILQRLTTNTIERTTIIPRLDKRSLRLIEVPSGLSKLARILQQRCRQPQLDITCLNGTQPLVGAVKPARSGLQISSSDTHQRRLAQQARTDSRVAKSFSDLDPEVADLKGKIKVAISIGRRPPGLTHRTNVPPMTAISG